jgi:gamma-glutamylcyclotransferase (GGCT)/AIG2-like uncharacterized protein YtfP
MEKELKLYDPERAFKKCPYVAVYGTLKKGYWNHHYLKDAIFVGEGITKENFDLFDVGYPMAVPNPLGLPLKVEVYKLTSPEQLEKLDFLEGFPYHYKRMIVDIDLFEGGKRKPIKAWIYYVTHPKGEKVEDIRYVEDVGPYLEWEG